MKNKLYRILCIACAAALALSVSACTAAKTDSDIGLSDETVRTDSSAEQKQPKSTSAPSSRASSVKKKKKSTPTAESKTSPAESTTAPAAQNEQITETSAVQITKIFKMPDKKVFEFPDMQYDTFYDDANGLSLPYRLYLPEGYDDGKKYPVFFFLHGAGERGSDNERHVYYLEKSFKTAGDILSEAIILAPQCPEYGWWNIGEQEDDYLGAAMHLLFQTLSDYACDRNRVYVAGLSMGGYATWSVLERYNNIFAAGVPICGWGNTMAGDRLAKIPIWIYHGDADNTVSYSCSVEMLRAIQNAGGIMVHFTALLGVGHNAWDYALSDRELFSWMFAQDRIKSKNEDDSYEPVPKLKIVSPDKETVFTEEDIEYFGLSTWDDEYCIAAYPSEYAQARLAATYKNNIGKEFSVWFLSQELYRFKPLTETPDDEFVFPQCFRQNLVDALY